MGLRFIPYYEVDENSPDSSYLAAGFRENLVETMRGWSELSCGFDMVSPVAYDIDGRETMAPAGILGSILVTREIMVVPVNITAMEVAVVGSCTFTDAVHFWRIELYNYTTTINYVFDLDNIPATVGLRSRLCSGLTSGAFYRLRVWAMRSNTLQNVSYICRGVRARNYV